MKTCTKCGEQKPLSEFYAYKDRKGREHRMARCKVCKRAEQAEYQKTEVWKQVNRRARWKYLYGITEEDYYRMLAEQGGVCAICKSPDPGPRTDFFHVDHDHACCPNGRAQKRTCGKCVRGLLCLGCNSDLGWLETHEAAITLSTASRAVRR